MKATKKIKKRIYIYIQNLKRNRMQKVKTRWNAINIARKN